MREGDRGKDYRLRQERRRLENGEKDLVTYKGEITTKQALQALTLFLLTSPPNYLTVQLPQTLGEIPLGRRVWVREGDREKGNTTVKDTLTCALIKARSLCNKKEEMVSYVYENTPDILFS